MCQQSLKEDLKGIVHRSRAEKCLVHARGIAEETKTSESLQKGVASLAIKERPVLSKVQFDSFKDLVLFILF